ncbi:MAG: pyrroline-5-carboxylate reductase [Phycisphaeraceae bacterium]|nr:pyrroline-5-carboxylate reductase [Phycisphaeraceae bacterium]
MNHRYALGFLGAGNMAEATAKAAVTHKVLPSSQIIAFDPSPARQDVFKKLGIALAASEQELVDSAQQVMLAVKPQMFAAVAAKIAPKVTTDHILISIMAGIPTAKIAAAVGKPARIIRVMPNTPLMAGLGMAAVADGPHAQKTDADLTMKLFATGQSKAVRVPESLMDAVTAVSGSGPAYIYYLAEAMEKAASELGLGDNARLMVAQTLLGATAMLVQSPDTAAELRRKVTSPGGTTEAAIKCLEAHNVISTVVEAIRAAANRSAELGA